MSEKEQIVTDIKGHRHYWGEAPEIHGFKFPVNAPHKGFERLARFLKENEGIVHSISIVPTADEEFVHELVVTVSR